MKIHKNDIVKILSGKDKGKTAKVLKVYILKNRVLIEGVNIVKRHVKPGKVSKDGGVISIERPIHVSNVMVIDKKSEEPTKVSKKIIDKKKYRISRKSGEAIQ